MNIAFLFSVIYFYLPGAFANMGCVIGQFVPIFRDIKTPIDRELTLRGKRLIGGHKTIGNMLFGIILGVSTGIIKYYFFDPLFPNYLILKSAPVQNLLLSFLMSFGAISGDLIKSIIKRQKGIPLHKAWIPFDEIDHTTISMLCVKIFFGISWYVVIATITCICLLHFISNLIGYALKIKKVPY